MPKLPHLSGNEVIKTLGKVGFVPARQRGSHVILVRQNADGKKGHTGPLHTEMIWARFWKSSDKPD